MRPYPIGVIPQSNTTTRKDFKAVLFLTGFLIFLTPFALSESPKYDYAITGASIYDGVLEQPFTSDIAVRDGDIVKLGSVRADEAGVLIDAHGWILTPGFIDTHTHSDFNPLIYPRLANKLLQGVTTEVVGNCGMSATPVLGRQEKQIHAVWAREGVEIPASLTWQTFGQYRDVLEKAGMQTDFAVLTGHGNLRTAVMGLDSGVPTERQLEKMKTLLTHELEAGSRGLSFGLDYLPGTFAAMPEIEALCEVVKEHNGICAFHIRSEGNFLIESIQEVLAVARQTGVKTEISHLKAGGKNNWIKMDQVFSLIETARQEGLQVMADAYPYTAGYAELAAVLPDFLYQRKDRLAFFKNPENRQEIIKQLTGYYGGTRDWDLVRIGTVNGLYGSDYRGQSIAQVATAVKKSSEAVLFDLLSRNDFKVSAFFFSQSPEVMGRVLKKPYVMIGSDSIADGSSTPHPRAFGTFAKLLRQTLDEKDFISTGEMVRKMTSAPAEFFGLKRTGKIREGYRANFVLWNPQTVSDQATYEHPREMSRGIEWVFLSGRPVVRKGQYEGETAGRVLA